MKILKASALAGAVLFSSHALAATSSKNVPCVSGSPEYQNSCTVNMNAKLKTVAFDVTAASLQVKRGDTVKITSPLETQITGGTGSLDLTCRIPRTENGQNVTTCIVQIPAAGNRHSAASATLKLAVYNEAYHDDKSTVIGNIHIVKQSLPAGLVGYVDASATGSAGAALGVVYDWNTSPVTVTDVKNLQEIYDDGYKTLVFGWMNVTGMTASITAGSQAAAIIQGTVNYAHAHQDMMPGMKFLISTGGAAGVFQPGSQNGVIGAGLTAQQISTLATNMVTLLKSNDLDGVDFDLEQQFDPDFLLQLIQDMRNQMPDIIVTAAPQLNQVQKQPSVIALVSTGVHRDYDEALKNNAFDAIFVQEYCTGGYTIDGQDESDTGFVDASFPTIANLLTQLSPQITTQIYLGEPSNKAGAGCQVNVFQQDSNAQNADQTELDALQKQYQALVGKSLFGGAMVWDLNDDYLNQNGNGQPFNYGVTINEAFTN